MENEEAEFWHLTPNAPCIHFVRLASSAQEGHPLPWSICDLSDVRLGEYQL